MGEIKKRLPLLKEHQEQLENYIEYKLSDEYKNSLVKKVQEEILIFQKETGYQDNFIENLKILSSSYREYLHQLEKLNKQYIYKFPQVQEF